MSTRIIGAMIMVHSDDSGLVLPPHVAPTQVMIVPIAQHKEGVLDKANELKDALKEVVRVDIDDSDRMPGWKFSEHEMRGVPLRLEIGPRDIKNNQVVAVRRDTGEKTILSIDDLTETIPALLETIQQSLYDAAAARLSERIYDATEWAEFTQLIAEKPGFVRAMWCGDLACEEQIKDETSATSRCLPFEQEQLSDTCICCGKPAKHMVIWGKAY